MEREEPRIGAPDLSELDFRRGERRAIPTPAREALPQLWWQIAVGVFLGMLLHSAVVGLYVRWETAQAMKRFSATLDAETKKIERQNDAMMRDLAKAAQSRPASTWTPPQPLRDGERCIKGERFRRLDNGWQHLPRQPCE